MMSQWIWRKKNTIQDVHFPILWYGFVLHTTNYVSPSDSSLITKIKLYTHTHTKKHTHTCKHSPAGPEFSAWFQMVEWSLFHTEWDGVVAAAGWLLLFQILPAAALFVAAPPHCSKGKKINKFLYLPSLGR